MSMNIFKIRMGKCWCHELSEKIMVAMIRELAGKSPHSTSSNITVFEAMAADAVSYADALLEELDKKK